MLKLRFQRVGKKHHATFRLVVSEAHKVPQANYLELLGSYDPHTKVIQFKKERIQHWLGVGAQPSPTVHNILVDQNIIEADKVRAAKGKKKPASAESSSESSESKDQATAGKKAEAVEAKDDKEVKAEGDQPATEEKGEKVETKTKDKSSSGGSPEDKKE